MKKKIFIIITIMSTLVFWAGLTQTVLCQEEQTSGKSDINDLSKMNLNDLLNIEVTTASKKAEKTTDAPGIITTISKEEIKYFGATSLTDILERVPSVQPFFSHLFGSNATIFRGDLRTLYNNHVLILFDGRPVREGVGGGLDFPIFSGFPVDMIERIEIIRGPGSVLYGSNAFAGVINIITKDDKKNSQLEVKTSGGSFGTVNGSINGELVKEDLKIKVGAKLGKVNGWDYNAMTVKPASPNLPVDFNAGQKNVGLVTDVSYKGLSLIGLYTYDVEDVLGILPYTPYQSKNKYTRIFLNLGYVYNLNENWEASVNGSLSRTEFKISDDSQIPVDHHQSTDYLGELTLNGKITRNFNLIFGGVLDSRNKYSVQPGDAIKSPYHLSQLTAYAQADYKPIEMLKLILGAQLNKPKDKKLDIVPRVGAIVNITNELGIKALNSSAYRSPWPIELFLQNPAIYGNPNLESEKINTTDVQLFYSRKGADLSLAYFYSHYSNSITRIPLPNQPSVATYSNQGTLNMYGLELEGKTTVISDVFITGSATYQKNLDKDKTVYIPNFMGKVGTFFNPVKNLTIGIFNTLYSKPEPNNGAQLNPVAKAVDLISFNSIYKLPTALNIEINFNIQNLLDEDYYYTEMSRGWVNSLPNGPGRAFYAGIGLKF